MDPILVSTATAFLTTLATKGADGPGKTLDLIWKNSLFKLDHFLENNLIKLENVQKLGDEVADNISKIPEDDVIEPINYSLINTIDNALLTVDQEEIRNMFSHLIAAHFDYNKQSDLHPSFIDIIKQLSPNDAMLLKKINREEVIPIAFYICYIDKEEFSYIQLTDPFFCPLFGDYRQSVNALQNLNRLNLIELDFLDVLTDDRLYSIFENNEIKLDIVSETKSFNEFLNLKGFKEPLAEEIIIKKGKARITNFGHSFYNVCD